MLTTHKFQAIQDQVAAEANAPNLKFWKEHVEKAMQAGKNELRLNWTNSYPLIGAPSRATHEQILQELSEAGFYCVYTDTGEEGWFRWQIQPPDWLERLGDRFWWIAALCGVTTTGWIAPNSTPVRSFDHVYMATTLIIILLLFLAFLLWSGILAK